MRSSPFVRRLVTGLALPAAIGAQQPERVLAVFAHPDDERVIGPLLSRLAREGRETHLVIATDGSKGVRPHSGFAAGPALAAERAAEARCAATRLGVRRLHLVGLEDGGLASFASLGRLRDEVARIIGEVRPSAVITFGPEGGTGHPDHRLTGNVVTQVVQGDTLHRAVALFYAQLPVERLRVAPRSSPGLNGVAEELLTVRIPVEERDVTAGRESFGCHRTQYTSAEMDAIHRTLSHVWNGVAYLRPWNGAAGVPAALRLPRGDTIRSILRTVGLDGTIETVHAEDRHFEAPNWSPDGRFFVVNSRGRLYRLAASGERRLDEIPTGFATRLNNDHGISPDGTQIVISHHAQEHVTDPGQDWLASSIYVLPVTGGAAPRKVTTRAPSFWHGWSPDGKTLAYVGRRDGEFDIYTIPVSGGEERRLTTCRGLDDGPDYSPDGRFIYYNSVCSGKMEIWRMRPDGGGAEQLTRDAYSNWFPHPSPDGRWLVYLAYLEDQGEAHPFGKQVKLRLMDLRDRSVRDLTPPFFGGQGTLNVPSWSPDSRRVAFVEYEIVGRR